MVNISQGIWGGIKDLLGTERFKELEGVVLTENVQGGKKGVSRRGGSRAERRTKVDYENMNSETQQDQRRYFPLCAQLDFARRWAILPSLLPDWHKQGNLASTCQAASKIALDNLKTRKYSRDCRSPLRPNNRPESTLYRYDNSQWILFSVATGHKVIYLIGLEQKSL